MTTPPGAGPSGAGSLSAPGAAPTTPSGTAPSAAPSAGPSPRRKVFQEIGKWIFVTFAMAVIAPFIVAIPARVAVAAESGQQVETLALIGVPEMAVACGNMMWGAFKDACDAHSFEISFRIFLLSVTGPAGTILFLVAFFGRKVTLDNFGDLPTWIQLLAVFSAITSIGISSVTSVVKGMA
ncbi:hypothetical protein [Actinoplanes aureus]|uniref:Uncharacterized protein n=1 Tax=Actinoplanes aureus TaxID=2792083 RepID=A0A931CJU5_9ACTN|nr:hypothetical protein [Actinoplanes aureus]MBG0569342.1 hypothetical protein [Actinoplanes aureus]